MSARVQSGRGRAGTALVTGGAGFIGANVVDRLASMGARVIVLDNLSRPEVERNLSWLRARHGDRVEVVVDDVRHAAALRAILPGVDRVFHFAAQVAVTTSLEDPLEDFDVNGRGTLTLLEALRAEAHPPSLVYTSTNKVYGALADVALVDDGRRWQPADGELVARGIGETRALDFHSPYGCSKGAAESYVLDYARSYGLHTVVFRMSCIYGPRQFGTEDQGWVAHFWRRALAGQPLTIYGDGRQVRDLLYVDDLVDALLLAHAHVVALTGRAFNLGGGSANALSLVELVERIACATGRRPVLTHADWRTGDQRWYVSDTRCFGDATGWRARVGLDEGLQRLGDWLIQLHATRPPLVEEARG
jgi:CDP-paratose 2-epimerase